MEERGLEAQGVCLPPGPPFHVCTSVGFPEMPVSGPSSCDGAESRFQRHCPDCHQHCALSGWCSRQSSEPHALQDRRLMAGDTAKDTAGPLVGFGGLFKVPVLLRGDETPTSGFLGRANPIYSLKIKRTARLGLRASEGNERCLGKNLKLKEYHAKYMQAENVYLFFLSHEGFSKNIQSRSQKSVRSEFTVNLRFTC